MGVMVGQASSDERGLYVGGAAGNQSGTELNVRGAYLYNWHTLIRFNDAGRARRCASAMADAVANMNIGYDQGQRNSILPLARAAGWRLGAIARACECDCSSLAGVCGIAAGAPESAIYVGGNLCYTGNIAQRFEATGLVSLYSTSDYVKSTVKWQVGDILVSDTHAVVVVSGGKTPQDGSAPTSNAAGNGTSDVDALARAVIAGRYGVGDARRAALGGKYEAVQARVNEMLSGTPNAAGTSTGTARIIAGTYKVVCGSLNVRARPSLSGAVVASYSRGERIYSVAADTVVADGYVWAHYVAYSGATRYVAMGTADGSEKYLAKS
ncbi:SH3 domain-containing protein [Xiamenia xianingshaonis]|uniref:SH3 domain-containing protein n=1 Tax=Xiamenia xianingshaonis TaxID=2682776 RepID=A0A9E6SUY8_9ACTN|nr:SH3 domain-containing protein [Xiamenia xianingshaonis]NHM14435.1 hypothetical protein [Xiamenia xianingshaonis]QTU84909.1 SH3 domain-containing protein [Xiamenia xianingshaonis]